MKNTLIVLFVLLAAVAGAQTNSDIYFEHSYGGGNSDILCTPSGANYVATAGIGDGTASIAWSGSTWVVSGLSSGIEYTTNAPEYPTNGAAYYLYRGGTNVTSGIYGNCTLTFYNFSAPVSTLVQQSLNGLWINSGDTIGFSYSGTVGPCTGTNGSPLSVALNEGVLYTSPSFYASNGTWSISGTLVANGTNVSVNILFGSSDTNNLAAGTNYIFAGVNTSTNTLFVYDQCGQCCTLNLTNLSLTSPNLDPHDPAGAAKAATNGYPWMAEVSSLITFTNPLTGAPGTSVLITNLGSGIVAVWQLTIPQGAAGAAGAPGTNTVTTQNFTNSVLSSQFLTYYQNNYFSFGTSNFVAVVPNLFSWQLVPPNLGGGGLLPGTNANEKLYGSFTGTNAWFAITNGFTTTNAIAVSVSGAGGGYGVVRLFGTDHPELLGRTNSFYGQHVAFSYPVADSDAATKNYVDLSIAAAALGSQWSAYSDSNNVSHYSYSVYGQPVMDLTSAFLWIGLGGTSVDGTGTNILITCLSSNLVGNWQMRSTTNLLIPFTVWTKYTTNISAGVCTFTVPMTMGTNNAQFFQLVKGTSTAIVADTAIAASGGVLYPSNSWNLATITNGMGNFAVWQGNSNGQALVSLYLSNGVVRIKQLAP